MSTTATTSVTPSAPVTAVRAPLGQDFAPEASAAQAPSPAAPAKADVPEPTTSQLKLVVAKADAGLAYSYTLVDQITGRVVAEIPHQAAKDAASRPDYTAGEVVDTHA